MSLGYAGIQILYKWCYMTYSTNESRNCVEEYPNSAEVSLKFVEASKLFNGRVTIIFWPLFNRPSVNWICSFVICLLVVADSDSDRMKMKQQKTSRKRSERKKYNKKEEKTLKGKTRKKNTGKVFGGRVNSICWACLVNFFGGRPTIIWLTYVICPLKQAGHVLFVILTTFLLPIVHFLAVPFALFECFPSYLSVILPQYPFQKV